MAPGTLWQRSLKSSFCLGSEPLLPAQQEVWGCLFHPPAPHNSNPYVTATFLLSSFKRHPFLICPVEIISSRFANIVLPPFVAVQRRHHSVLISALSGLHTPDFSTLFGTHADIHYSGMWFAEWIQLHVGWVHLLTESWQHAVFVTCSVFTWLTAICTATCTEVLF